jgi:hypothetical protein
VKEKKEKTSPRYFRVGIEANYPVWRSEIDFWDNSFPYTTVGAGLFFRIGPEFLYFTTGAYANIDALYKEGAVSAELNVFGINIATLPLLDLEWTRVFVEVPLLLSFGSGQIRFTGGILLDFYAVSQLDINVSENVQIWGGSNVISANDAETIEDRFNDVPDMNGYFALGLDFDIVRYWGIGVKFLIWSAELSDHDYSFDDFSLSRFQTRVSTYFVF